jgi:hypothetical protein
MIQGQATDVDKAWELDKTAQGRMNEMVPDVISGIVAWHPQNGRFTNALYFTNETEAREGGKESLSRGAAIAGRPELMRALPRPQIPRNAWRMSSLFCSSWDGAERMIEPVCMT